ncbi:MAG TPA: hypothetical protein VHJ34_02915 [Actinomycetota bacterium]|nr:hypothetical protein [Actinomycetota bacterium]
MRLDRWRQLDATDVLRRRCRGRPAGHAPLVATVVALAVALAVVPAAAHGGPRATAPGGPGVRAARAGAATTHGVSDPGTVPDGRIVFSATWDGDSEIYAIDADGTRLRQITRNRVHDWSPTWHPSSHKVAFVRRHGPTNDEIFTKSLRTGTVRRVTFSRWEYDGSPDYGPDGSWIVFDSEADEDGSRIRAVRPRDGATRLVAEWWDEGEAFMSAPTWSPDGTRIAYVVHEYAPPYIAFSDFDPAVRRRAARPDPADATAGNQTCVATNEGPRIDSLAWSPDGATLAFYGPASATHGGLCLLDVATDERRVLLYEPPVPMPGAWAPQGGYMAASLEAGDYYDVVVVDAQSGEIVPLVADAAAPDWVLRPE